MYNMPSSFWVECFPRRVISTLILVLVLSSGVIWSRLGLPLIREIVTDQYNSREFHWLHARRRKYSQQTLKLKSFMYWLTELMIDNHEHFHYHAYIFTLLIFSFAYFQLQILLWYWVWTKHDIQPHPNPSPLPAYPTYVPVYPLTNLYDSQFWSFLHNKSINRFSSSLVTSKHLHGKCEAERTETLG